MNKFSLLASTAAIFAFLACGTGESEKSDLNSLRGKNMNLGVLKLKSKDGSVQGFTLVVCPTSSLDLDRTKLLKSCIPALKKNDGKYAVWKLGTEKRWADRIALAADQDSGQEGRLASKVFAGFAAAPLYFFSESYFTNVLFSKRSLSRLRGRTGTTIAVVASLTLAVGAYELLFKTTDALVDSYTGERSNVRNRLQSYELSRLKADINSLLADSHKPIEEQFSEDNEFLLNAKNIPLLLEEIASYYSSVKVNAQIYGL